jgi:hypothetical protein
MPGRVGPGPSWPPAAALAAVGAAAVLAASAGDVVVAVLALCVAGGVRVGLVAALVAAATVARWGTTDLGAVAGDQAVLGVAVATGDGPARLGSGLAAVALLLVASRRPGPWPWATAVALGVGAAALAAGPAVGRTEDLAVRVAASVVGVALAVVVAAEGHRRPAWARALPVAALLAASGALALGLAG